MLPKEAIEEFKRIYERNFKEKLSEEEIFLRAIKLLNLYKAVYRSLCGQKDREEGLDNEVTNNPYEPN